MKLHKYLLSACLVSFSAALVSCDDDDIFVQDGKEAFILGTDHIDCLKVIGRSGVVWKSRMSNDTIYIQVSPTVNPEEELDNVVAKFYISKGATVMPDPEIPQNFAKKGGVKYTVTSEDGKTTHSYIVTHGLTDIIEFGKGFTRGMTTTPIFFTDLGYPGEQGNYDFTDSRLYGDLNGYVAFCGHDHVVLMAGQYSNPKFDNPDLAVPDASLAFKVFNVSDFSTAGSLNLGSIPMASIRCITSDVNGVFVAGVNNGSNADIYYWDSFGAQPKLLAHFDDNLFMAPDGSNYIQVTGDIFGACNICTNATRGPEGNHYMIHLENGQVTDNVIVSTGYSSGDGCGWQMISALKPDLHSSYLMGDTDPTIKFDNGNNTIRVMANTFSGTTKVHMPNVLQSNWESWWVGNGNMLLRTGARRPYVSAMYINGKYYASITNGTNWWWHNDIADIDDLDTRVVGTSVSFSVNAGWSFGGSTDWYWDPEINEGFLVGYADRYGAYVTRLTCYE